MPSGTGHYKEPSGQEKSPSAIFLRQTSISYTLVTKLDCHLIHHGSEAGIVLMQSNQFYYRFCLQKEETPRISFFSCINGKEKYLIARNIDRFPSYLHVAEQGLELSFSYSYDGIAYETLASEIDASILSTERAGGFVGTCLGLYTYTPIDSFGEDYADFDFLSYQVTHPFSDGFASSDRLISISVSKREYRFLR